MGSLSSILWRERRHRSFKKEFELNNPEKRVIFSFFQSLAWSFKSFNRIFLLFLNIFY